MENNKIDGNGNNREDNAYNENIFKIYEKIDSGVRRISVATTQGYNGDIFSVQMAKALSQKYARTCQIISNDKKVFKKERKEIRKNGIIIKTVDKFIDKKTINENDILIFIGLDLIDRRIVEKIIKDTEYITISIFYTDNYLTESDTPKKDMSQYNSLYSNHSRLVPFVCIFETKGILDIRDINEAENEEKRVLKEEVSVLREEVDKNIGELRREQNYLLEQFSKKTFPLGWLSIASISSKSTHLFGNTDIQIKGNEIDKSYDAESELKEINVKLAQQKEMINFLMTLLRNFGISPEVIETSFELIQETRNSLKNELESENEELKEIAFKKLQDRVVEIVNGLTCNYISVSDTSFYTNYYVEKLTPEIWEKIEDKSRNFLITAKNNFDSMKKLPNKEKLDYSGVCLLVTKALEVEVTKRFFTKYKEFLLNRYGDISMWPYALRRRDNRGQITDEVILDNDFTLGSVVQTVGYKRDFDEKDNIIGYSLGHFNTKRTFIDYAVSELYKSPDRRKAEFEIEKDIEIIEKVRIDYRNPSAHREELSFISANNCMAYVIDVQHKLKELLKNMKF